MPDCIPCGRAFKDQGALNQHMQKSSAHKNPTRGPPQVQNPLQAKLPQPKPKQLEYRYPIRVKAAGPQRTLGHGIGSVQQTLATTQYKYGESSNVATSSTPQVTKSAITQGVAHSWFSVIPESEHLAVLDALTAHCHSPGELKSNGYHLDLYNPLDYVNTRKCKRCSGREQKVTGSQCIFHSYKRNKYNPNRPYKCCRMIDGIGCQTSPTHDFQLPLRALQHGDFSKTPPASALEPKFRAVVLDCEMAGIANGSGEVIFLCVSDYLTGAIILNRYVNPNEKITQMRSSIHGITKSTLSTATSQGQALSGWQSARSELLKYIDANTILVGHALDHDLNALRMIHHRVVDSGILSRNAVGVRRVQWGLQALCPELLGYEIRKNQGGVHDCLEDVLATREVVLFCTRQTDAFQTWAQTKRIEQLRLEEERERVRQEKKIQKEKKNKEMDEGYGGQDYYDEEVVLWADITEDCGYPHPDTGYDPWSD